MELDRDMERDKKDKKKDKEKEKDGASSSDKPKDFKDILNAKFENAMKMQHDDASSGGGGSRVGGQLLMRKRGDMKDKSEKENKKKEKKEREKKEKERDKDTKGGDKDKAAEKDKEKEKEKEKEAKDKEKDAAKEREKEFKEAAAKDKRASGIRGGKVFGGQLKEGLYDKKGTKHAVPPFFEHALAYIEERALETTGLFQEAGPKKEVKELIKRIEAKQDIEWAKIKNPHTVSSLILKYLRDLEEPVFPYYLYSHLIETVSKGEAGLQVNESALRQLLHALPAPNVAFLKRLLPFLRQVAAHASKNQLVAESLATFFGPVLMRTEGEASLQALVSHTSEILFLTAYMINFTPTDLLFSFPEEGSNQRLSNYSSPYMETDSLKVDDRPGARSRPTSTEPTAASALGTDEEGRVPRRPTIPYAPLRISNTAAPAEDTASVYIDEQSLDDSQSYCPPHEPSGLRADGSDQFGDRSDVVRVHGSPIGRPGHVREPSGAPWAGGGSELAKSFDYSESPNVYQESAGSSMAWFVWLVRSLPSQTYHQARTWPDYDESADIYLVNDNELYVYPEHSEFFAVFTSELYRVEDSSRYYFIISDEGDKLGIIFSTREESAAFARAIEPGLGYDIPVGGVWDNAGGKVGGGTDPKWKSQKKDKSKSVVVRDEGDTICQEFEEKEVMHDGWFDAPAKHAGLSLNQLRTMPVNLEEREVIEVDARHDARLQNILRLTQLLFSKFPTLETKVRVIALQVANALGGVYSEDLREIHVAHIQNVKKKLQSNVVPLGSIKFGVLRHRVILFKYLCDHLHPSLPCTLSMNEEGMLCNLVPVSSNITKYKGVDVMAVPGRLRAEGRDRKIMWRGSQGAASAERHVILPDLQSEPIVFHKKLGEGGFSTVYRCAIGPLTCAAKVYKRTDDRIGKELVRECMIQTHLSHKNILGCLGYEKTATDFRIFFEYMGLGSFWDVLYRRKVALKPFEPKEIAYYASEVARGLHYLHRNKIFHRDIKSANILVDGDEGEFFKSVKLCDFNISTYRSDAFSRVGTPQYMAPELLNNTEGRPIDTEKADMWSFGMFIVELITLDAPYAGLAEGEYARLISRGILPPNLPSVKENKGVELVIKCCNLNPALRPSARDVVVYLNPLDDSCNVP